MILAQANGHRARFDESESMRIAQSATATFFKRPGMAARSVPRRGSFGPENSNSETVDKLAAEPATDCHPEPAGGRYCGRPYRRRDRCRIGPHREADEKCEPCAAHHEHVPDGGILCGRSAPNSRELEPAGEDG